jgi:hypothetical protein
MAVAPHLNKEKGGREGLGFKIALVAIVSKRLISLHQAATIQAARGLHE